MESPTNRRDWLDILHRGVDPFGDAPTRPADVQGWNSDGPLHRAVIEAARAQYPVGSPFPFLVVEVGAWKGAGTIALAEHVGPGGLVVSVDTWLGAAEFLGRTNPQHDLRPERGYPTVYETWRSNVARSGLADRVVPFPQTSAIALRWMRERNVHADVVYLDGSHDEEDVVADLDAAMAIRHAGGIVFGDDLSADWPGVRRGLARFAMRLPPRALDLVTLGPWWALVGRGAAITLPDGARRSSLSWALEEDVAL